MRDLIKTFGCVAVMGLVAVLASACSSNPTPIILESPEHITFNQVDGRFEWNRTSQFGYTVYWGINSERVSSSHFMPNSMQLQNGVFNLRVRAMGNGSNYLDSGLSPSFKFHVAEDIFNPGDLNMRFEQNRLWWNAFSRDHNNRYQALFYNGEQLLGRVDFTGDSLCSTTIQEVSYLQSGIYTVRITSAASRFTMIGENMLVIYSNRSDGDILSSDKVEFYLDKLDTPQNPRFQGEYFMWDQVNHALGHQIQISDYLGNFGAGATTWTTINANPQLNVFHIMRVNPTLFSQNGNYSFRVQSRRTNFDMSGLTPRIWADSEYSESVPHLVGFVSAPVASNVRIESDRIAWDRTITSIPVNYIVRLRVGERAVSSWATGSDAHISFERLVFDILGQWEGYFTGQATISVRTLFDNVTPIENGVAIIHSRQSETVPVEMVNIQNIATPTNITFEDNYLTWDSVDDADFYFVGHLSGVESSNPFLAAASRVDIPSFTAWWGTGPSFIQIYAIRIRIIGEVLVLSISEPSEIKTIIAN